MPSLLLSEAGHAQAACSVVNALATALLRYQPVSAVSLSRELSLCFFLICAENRQDLNPVRISVSFILLNSKICKKNYRLRKKMTVRADSIDFSFSKIYNVSVEL